MNKFNLQNYKGGWTKDSLDKRDYKWSSFFGSSTPGADELPTAWSWFDSCPLIPEQLNIPSCVSNSFAFLQAFHSKRERGFNDLLSWAFIWANISKTQNGSTFRDNAICLQDKGVSEEKLYTKEIAIAQNFDKSKISQEAIDNALIYRIKNYSYIPLSELKRAIFREPIIIAAGGNNINWQDFTKLIEFCGYNLIEWYHAICIIGWNEQGWEFVNWWGKGKDHGFLKMGYPLEAMISVEDIPDLLIKKTNMEFVKVSGNSTVYAINNSNMEARAIYDSEDYMNLTGDLTWSMVKTITASDLAKYRIVGKLLSFLR